MSRHATLVAAALTACSFRQGATSVDGAVAQDASLRCAVACNTYATCDVMRSPPQCVCNAGLSGDGVTSCVGPSSCGGLEDGDNYTLYVGGDPSQPWTATCAGQNAYLAVSGSNFGQYTHSTNTGGSDVRTTFSKIRIDPAQLTVDVDDVTFASSVGRLQHGGNPAPMDTVTSMPLGVAMDCAGPNSETGVGGVDLSGTPFTITSAYARQGNNTGSAATTPAPDHRSIALTGGGNCGWTAVTASPNNPFNANGGGFILKLAYTPL